MTTLGPLAAAEPYSRPEAPQAAPGEGWHAIRDRGSGELVGWVLWHWSAGLRQALKDSGFVVEEQGA